MEEFLKVIACRESVLDDEDFETFDGGNFDDTFNSGVEAGRIDLARELLKEFFGEGENDRRYF